MRSSTRARGTRCRFLDAKIQWLDLAGFSRTILLPVLPLLLLHREELTRNYGIEFLLGISTSLPFAAEIRLSFEFRCSLARGRDAWSGIITRIRDRQRYRTRRSMLVIIMPLITMLMSTVKRSESNRVKIRCRLISDIQIVTRRVKDEDDSWQFRLVETRIRISHLYRVSLRCRARKPRETDTRGVAEPGKITCMRARAHVRVPYRVL